MNVNKVMRHLCASLGMLFALGLEAQECKARVITPVVDEMGNHYKAGNILPVDIDRENGTGGTFCASGGSCVPRKLSGNDAVVLVNCKVGPALGGGDFRLVPDSSKMGSKAAAKLQSRQNTVAKLNDLGFSNASAGSLADDYANHPHSKTGRLVANALAGSQTALAALKRSNP